MMCTAPAPTNPIPADSITIKARYRRSPRSIDPEFDACTECIVGFSGGTGKNNKPLLTITPMRIPSGACIRVRQRSFGHPPLLPTEGRGHTRSRSNSASLRYPSRERVGERFSVVDAIGVKSKTESGNVGQLEIDEGSDDVSDEGEWVGDGQTKGAGDDGGDGKVMREGEGLPPTTPFNPKRDNSPLVREYSNVSRTPSQTKSESFLNNSTRSTSRSRSHSRSRSQSRVGVTPMRKRSMGAASAFDIDTRNRSLTPAKQRGCSVEEDPPVEPITLLLGDVVSVDQEVPSRRRMNSAGSDFFSSAASDTGSSHSPPPPSNSVHCKSALYRIFLHTSSHGYIEFSFDTPNSHDILMAFLSAHLKPNQLPRKTPNNKVIPPLEGALQTMVLTPSTLEKRVPSNLNLHRPLKLTRSTSTDSACTLDKLQKKIIQQRIQQESTPLEKIKEQLSSWMSSIDLSFCCQDTTVDPDDKSGAPKRGIVANGDVTPDTKSLKKKGIGGLSFEESISLTPKLSFEKSVATDRSSMR